MKHGALDTDELEELLAWFLRRAKGDTRADLMARYPQHYAKLYPGVNRQTMLDRVGTELAAHGALDPDADCPRCGAEPGAPGPVNGPKCTCAAACGNPACAARLPTPGARRSCVRTGCRHPRPLHKDGGPCTAPGCHGGQDGTACPAFAEAEVTA
jgi:hypothetical protein